MFAHWLAPIAKYLNGWPWEGRQMLLETSPVVTDALGGAIDRATAEAADHPGLYQAFDGDCVTVQLTMRAGWYVSPESLGAMQWIPADEAVPNG